MTMLLRPRAQDQDPGAPTEKVDRVLVLHDGTPEDLRFGVHWATFFGVVVSALTVAPISAQHDRPGDDCIRGIREQTADLLVVASGARGGLRGPAGLPEHLLAELGIPVLVCGDSAARPVREVRSVLVPVNGTEWDSIALHLVLKLARAAQAEEVTLLRVVESLPGWLDPDLDSSELARAVAYANGLASACAGTRVAVRTLVRTGPIVSTVGAVARQIDADVVALSTRARTGSALAVHGSIAGAIARRVPQTVLLMLRS